MPDPHVLYAVTAVVMLGLVAWVISVLLRPAFDPSPRTARKASPSEPTTRFDTRDGGARPPT